jgi:hypothetical protein
MQRVRVPRRRRGMRIEKTVSKLFADVTTPRLALVLSLAATPLAGCSGSSSDAAESSDPTAPFVGTWNYDQPNTASGLGIATLSCPAGNGRPALALKQPQVGNVVYTKTGDGTFSGTTDVGCHWTFAVNGNTADLSPASQRCENNALGASYTLTKWTITVQGNTETETIEAAADPSTGCKWELPQAGRTLVDPNAADDPTTAFVGTWAFDAPDFAAGRNVAMLTCPAGPGAGQPKFVPFGGTLSIAKSADQLVTLTSGQCSWNFHVDGTTAELQVGGPPCPTGQAPSFWTMVSDGQHISAVVSEANQGCRLVLGSGALTKK